LGAGASVALRSAAGVHRILTVLLAADAFGMILSSGPGERCVIEWSSLTVRLYH
jgi:hypothetical protein